MIDPTSIFLVVGQELNDLGIFSGSPEEYRELRILSEKNSRNASLNGEVTFAQIIEELAGSAGIDEGNINAIKEIELREEAASIFLVPNAKVLTDVAREKYGRLIYVSDMYLPDEFIKGQLQRFDLLKEEDYVFISAQVGLNKFSGKLFDHIARNYPEGTRFLHHGDNKFTDIKPAKKKGWGTKYISDCIPNRYEKLPESQLNSIALSRLLAQLRLKRLMFKGSEKEVALRSIGMQVLGPVLCDFAWEISRKCEKVGAQRIYCVASNGQEIKYALDNLCNIGIPLPPREYLPVSRQALVLPVVSVGGESLIWPFDENTKVSVEAIFKKFGVEIEAWRPWLDERGWNKSRCRQRLSVSEKPEIESWLSSGELHDHICTNAQLQLSLLSELLTDLKFSISEKVLLVDAGTSGTTLNDLRVVGDFNKWSKEIVRCYCLGFQESHPVTCGNACDENTVVGSEKMTILELLLSATRGHVVGYDRVDNEVRPRMLTAQNSAVIASELREVRKGLDEFFNSLEHVASGCGVEMVVPQLVEVSKRNLSLLVFDPGEMEAATIGSWPIGESSTISNEAVLAPKLNIFSATREIFNQRCHKSYWSSGIEKNSGKVVSLYFKLMLVAHRTKENVFFALKRKMWKRQEL